MLIGRPQEIPANVFASSSRMQKIRIFPRNQAAVGRGIEDQQQQQLRTSSISPEVSTAYDATTTTGLIAGHVAHTQLRKSGADSVTSSNRCDVQDQRMKGRCFPIAAAAGGTVVNAPVPGPLLYSATAAATVRDKEALPTGIGRACVTKDLFVSLDDDQQSDVLSSYSWDASTSTDSSVCWSTSSVASRPTSAGRKQKSAISERTNFSVKNTRKKTNRSPPVYHRHLSSRTALLNPPLPKPQRLPVDLTPFLTESIPQKPEKSVDTQTDAIQNYGTQPQYCPRKRGVDNSTQTAVGEELFCFEKEVAPLLDVLTWRTIEEAQTEVLHESELARLAAYRERCRALQQERLQQLEETLTLERQRVEQINKLEQLGRERHDKEKRVIRKLSAVDAVDTLLFLDSTLLRALDRLQAAGAFVEDTNVAVETLTVPSLLTQAAGSLKTRMFACTLTTQVLKASAKKKREQIRATFGKWRMDTPTLCREEHKKVADVRRGRLRFTLTASDFAESQRRQSSVTEKSQVGDDEKDEEEDEGDNEDEGERSSEDSGEALHTDRGGPFENSATKQSQGQNDTSHSEQNFQSPVADYPLTEVEAVRDGRRESSAPHTSNANFSESLPPSEDLHKGKDLTEEKIFAILKEDVTIGPIVAVRTSERRDCIRLEELHDRILLWIKEHIPLLEGKLPHGFDIVMDGKPQMKVASLLHSHPDSLFIKPRLSSKSDEDEEQQSVSGSDPEHE